MCTTFFRMRRRSGLRMAETWCVVSRGAAGGARRGFPVRRSPLRCDCTAVRGPGQSGITRCVRFAHCAQTGCRKSEHEARTCAPAPALCSSSPHRSPPTGIACRAEAVLERRQSSANITSAKPRVGRPVQRASETPRSAGRWACARSAHRPHFSGSLSERSACRARSEFCRTARRPSTAGKGRACPRPVSVKRCAGWPARGFAARSLQTNGSWLAVRGETP